MASESSTLVPSDRPAARDELVPIDMIRVGRRHRKDMGDLAGLTESVRELRLLQPVGLLPDYTLVFGARRLAACKAAGLLDVPARVFPDLRDAADALRVERDENVCRKPMLPSELVSLGLALEEVERPAARDRQQAGGGGNGSGKLPDPSPPVRDRVAAALGWSGRTYEKAKEVVAAAAADPAADADLVALMDAQSVEAAHREMRERRSPSYPRPGQFCGDGPDASEAVSVVRGAIIAWLDHAFLNGRLGELLGRDHPDAAVRSRALDLFQEIQRVLCPEEFGEPSDPPGVIPHAGPRRAGPDRLAAFAEVVTGKSATKVVGG